MNTVNNKLEKVLQKIKDLGWSVEKETDHLFHLGKFTPAGQDFRICVYGETVEELCESIHEQYEQYDVSEQTYLWLDNTGHGTNGAPYEMKDVLKDMETCEQYILDLYNALTK